MSPKIMEELNRLDWIKKMYPDYKEEKWINDNVIRPEEIENYEFYEKKCTTYEDYIDPRKIIGIKYADAYNCSQDITWLELLNSLKRLYRVIENFKTYDEVIDHIKYNKSNKYVSKYGDYYITTSGQHRLCLAKFLNLEKVKVFINEYKFNESRFNYYNLLKENIELLESLGYHYKTDKELLEQTTIKYSFLKFGKFELVIHSDIMPFFIDYYKKLNPNFVYAKYAQLKCNFEPQNTTTYIESIEKLKKYKHILMQGKLKKIIL